MITIKPLPGNMTMSESYAMIATGFGSGRISPAPGTWGTLAAWILAFFWGQTLLMVAIPFALLGGVWAIRKFQEHSGDHDNGMIVIDEWVGIWITLLFATFIDQWILAFILFRIFDIWKPFPIGWLDKKVPGAWGVMIDDVVAGLFAGLCLYGYGLWMH